MDGLYRENTVDALLAKLKTARSKDTQEYYQAVNLELDSITEKIINLDDKAVYPVLTLIIAVPLFLITIFSIFKMGLTLRIFPIIGLAGFMVYFRIYIVSLYQVKKTYHDKHSLAFIRSRISYVQNGVYIKERRMRLIEIMYYIFFPLLLFMVGDWYNYPHSGFQLLMLFALAVILGGGGFFLLFNYIRTDYGDIKSELAILEEEMNK